MELEFSEGDKKVNKHISLFCLSFPTLFIVIMIINFPLALIGIGYESFQEYLIQMIITLGCSLLWERFCWLLFMKNFPKKMIINDKFCELEYFLPFQKVRIINENFRINYYTDPYNKWKRIKISRYRIAFFNIILDNYCYHHSNFIKFAKENLD